MSRNTPWRTTRKMYALSQARNDWYRIRNQVNGPTQLHIYDEIGYFGVSAGDLVRDLADVTGPLEVHLNSPGGEVFDGITIYNTLLARKDVAVVIDGLAASIASVIAMAGNPVLIARNAQMMIHDGHGMAIGNAQDMRDLAEILDRTSNNIASIYSDHTGRAIDYWRQLMKAETWYNAQDAIDAGLADRFVDSGAGRQAATITGDWDLSVFRGAARVSQKDAAAHPYHGQHEMMHEPVTGIHHHNHAAFGSGDADDGIHSHAHQHAGDADHSHSHTSHSHSHDHEDVSHRHAHEVGMESYGPHEHDHVHHSGTEDIGHGSNAVTGAGARTEMYSDTRIHGYTDADIRGAWDAGKAWAACSSASDYRSVCAGERNAGESDQRQHWALPHHDGPGKPANPDGVSHALGRWNQTNGLKNKEAARAHLLAHQGSKSGDHSEVQLTDEEIAAFTAGIRL